jgi:DMATS type aromatic prenyltransferase
VSPHTKFSSVREIMTLGGRVNLPGLNVQLADLYDLIKAVTDLPLDACETDEIRPVSNGNSDVRSPENGLEDILLHGNRYCFNITPGKTMPEIRMYLQLRLNGRDDSTIARGLVSWMEAHGRGAYCQAFLHMLRNGLGGHRRLDWSTGIQTSLACQFKDGELEVTSYLGPEAFHLGRMQKERPNGRRGTRRRDE